MAVFAVYQNTLNPNMLFHGFQFVNSWLTFDISDTLTLAAFRAALQSDPTNAVQIQLVNERVYRDSLDAVPGEAQIFLIPGPQSTIPGPIGLQGPQGIQGQTGNAADTTFISNERIAAQTAATTAGQQAGIATNDATNAGVAATVAQAAANGLYTTVAAGLAAVADGAPFLVQGNGNTYAELYRRNGANAVDQNLAIPSLGALLSIATSFNMSLENRLNILFAHSSNLYGWEHAQNGYIDGGGNQNGSGPGDPTQGYFTTNLMPVNPGESYTSNFDGAGNTYIRWRDVTGTQISVVPGFKAGTAVVAPANAATMEASFQPQGPNNVNVFYGLIIVNGTAAGTNPGFGYVDPDGAAKIATSHIRATQPTKVDLFDYRQVTQSLIDAGGNESAQNGAYVTTSYIPVTPGGVVVFSESFVPGNVGYGPNWYNQAKKRIGSTAGGVTANQAIPVPVGAYYMRCSLYGDTRTQQMLQITDSVINPGDIVIGLYALLDLYRWAGQGYGTLGDSIEQSSAAGGNDYIQTMVNRYLRANYIYGGAVAGRTFAQLLDGVPQSTPGSMTRQGAAIAADFNGVNLLKIAAGTNSFGLWDGSSKSYLNGRPMGTLGDTSAAGTFYGDMYGIICEKLLTWHPEMRIAMTTPFQRFDGNDPTIGDPQNTLGLHLSDYVAAEIKFANYFGIPIKNLFTESGINQYTASRYLGDKLHPNPTGYMERLIPVVFKWLNQL